MTIYDELSEQLHDRGSPRPVTDLRSPARDHPDGASSFSPPLIDDAAPGLIDDGATNAPAEAGEGDELVEWTDNGPTWDDPIDQPPQDPNWVPGGEPR